MSLQFHFYYLKILRKMTMDIKLPSFLSWTFVKQILSSQPFELLFLSAKANTNFIPVPSRNSFFVNLTTRSICQFY